LEQNSRWLARKFVKVFQKLVVVVVILKITKFSDVTLIVNFV